MDEGETQDIGTFKQPQEPNLHPPNYTHKIKAT